MLGLDLPALNRSITRTPMYYEGGRPLSANSFPPCTVGSVICV